MVPPLLEVTGLSCRRGGRPVFDRLSFGLGAGELLALTGRNGSGKTSLLRALAGFLRPDVGTVAYESVELSEARRRHLHWQGPLDGLKSARRAGDELAFQARYAGADADGIAAAVDLLALTPLLDLEVRQLSAGQKRRLALARLIAAPRPLWLLDEPLSPLDARWRAVMGTLIQAHVEKGGAVIAAVHDPLPVPARPLDLGGGR